MPPWTVQEPHNHQLFPKRKLKELGVESRSHQPPPSAPQRSCLPQCSAFPADALKIQAGCSSHSDSSGPGSTFLPSQGKSTGRGVFKGGPSASLGGPLPRSWGSRRPPGVAGYFWVWRGRGTVKGTGNWGAGVGKPKEFFQSPPPLLKGPLAP